MLMRARMFFLMNVVMLAILFAGAADASDSSFVPDRRRDQFQKSYGYALFPYPYSLPGLGSGLGVVGGASNIADTYTDVYGLIFTGDVRGEALGVADVHIIPRHLILDTGFGSINEATVQSYSKRGMNTDKHDYRLIEFGDTAYYGGRLTATFYDRRLEFYGAWYQGAMQLKSIRDQDGQCHRRSAGLTSRTRRCEHVRDASRSDRRLRRPTAGSPDRCDAVADAITGFGPGLLRDGL